MSTNGTRKQPTFIAGTLAGELDFVDLAAWVGTDNAERIVAAVNATATVSLAELQRRAGLAAERVAEARDSIGFVVVDEPAADGDGAGTMESRLQELLEAYVSYRNHAEARERHLDAELRRLQRAMAAGATMGSAAPDDDASDKRVYVKIVASMQEPGSVSVRGTDGRAVSLKRQLSAAGFAPGERAMIMPAPPSEEKTIDEVIDPADRAAVEEGESTDRCDFCGGVNDRRYGCHQFAAGTLDGHSLRFFHRYDEAMEAARQMSAGTVFPLGAAGNRRQRSA